MEGWLRSCGVPFCGPEIVSIVVYFTLSEYLPGGKTQCVFVFVLFAGFSPFWVWPSFGFFLFLLASWPQQ